MDKTAKEISPLSVLPPLPPPPLHFVCVLLATFKIIQSEQVKYVEKLVVGLNFLFSCQLHGLAH